MEGDWEVLSELEAYFNTRFTRPHGGVMHRGTNIVITSRPLRPDQKLDHAVKVVAVTGTDEDGERSRYAVAHNGTVIMALRYRIKNQNETLDGHMGLVDVAKMRDYIRSVIGADQRHIDTLYTRVF